MSKSNSIKKINTKTLSPPGNLLQLDNIQNKSSSSIKYKLPNSNEGIIEVYQDNFIQELINLSILLEDYNYIGMDTEFPGTVFSVDNMTDDFYYKTLRQNVNKLKLIQLGITLKNEKGEYPKNYPYHTWQFNLEFDKNKEPIHPSSLNLLKQSGIDFDNLKKKGISHKLFSQYFMVSDLVLNPDIHWVSFQGAYDFGYLLKFLLGTDLPEREEEFIGLLDLYFINYYDIRILVRGNENMQRGLNKLAEKLDVVRVGKIHQAGSDAMVTIDVFFKLKKSGFVNRQKLEELKNVVYGIGNGRDNTETINYTHIVNNNDYQSSNNNGGVMFTNMNSLGKNYINMNMNYYNFPLILNNQMSPLAQP